MHFKKWTALLLCLVMAFALAACSGGTTETTTNETTEGQPAEESGAALASIIPEETVELTVFTQLANFSGKQMGWSAEKLKELFNVEVTIINDPDGGTLATRMADGNLGDIVIFGTDGNDYMNAVNAGMLFDWEEEDLISTYGAYIAEKMPDALEKNLSISGGKLYGFGHNVAVSATDHESFFYYPYLRYDLYQQIGSPEIATLEDFIPVLEQMQALEPTSDAGTKTYGVSLFPDWDGTTVMMVKSTAALYGYDEFGFGLYDVKTQTFEDALKEDGMYLRCLKFYNTLFQKGLLDPDSMTQTFDDMSAKYTNGSAFFNIFSWMAESFNSNEHKEAGKLMGTVAAADQKNLVYGLNTYGSNRIWTIGANTNYPELCMAIINWFSTPEGNLTYLYGPKGVTWDYNAEGNTYLTELGLQAQQDKENTQITYGTSTDSYKAGEFQHNNTTWTYDTENLDSASGETYNYNFWQSTLETKAVTDIETQWREWAGALNTDEYLENNGHVAISLASDFTMAAREAELETTWQQVQTSVKANSWSAIYAPTDAEYDAIVAKMIEEAKAYGYDQCVTWSQEQAGLRKAAENK